MKKIIFLILVIAASLVIIRAFFMPWASVSASVVKASRRLTDTAGEPLMKIPKFKEAIKELEKATDVIEALGDVEIESTVSGCDLPTMVNQKGSKLAISFMQVLFEETKNLDKKSYLVYLLPILAVICIFFAIFGLRYKISIIIMLILSGVISIAGLYNLNTVDLSNLAVDIVIREGLWYTLYAYSFIFFVSILWLIWER